MVIMFIQGFSCNKIGAGTHYWQIFFVHPISEKLDFPTLPKS